MDGDGDYDVLGSVSGVGVEHMRLLLNNGHGGFVEDTRIRSVFSDAGYSTDAVGSGLRSTGLLLFDVHRRRPEPSSFSSAVRL